MLVLIGVLWIWPFHSVPTRSRGAFTQFGRIIGIQPESSTVLLSWQKMAPFSIRAEQTNIDNASGATLDIHPVSVRCTVRYSIATDKVAEVYEKYLHDGYLSSDVQTATNPKTAQ